MTPVTEHPWGPLPDLADGIARQFVPWASHRGSWPSVTAEHGGVWRWPVRAQFAEADPVTPVPSPWWRRPPRWRWLRGLAESWFGRRFGPPLDDRLALPPDDWSRLVMRAQLWLASRNVRSALPWFVPFARDLPTAFSMPGEATSECPHSLSNHLMAVSHVGVFWGLAAWELANGRVGGLQFLSTNPQPWVARLRPERLADALALHFLIETIVAGQTPACATEDTPARVQGGLRQPDFLRRYPKLAADPAGARWMETLNRFVAHSPLTQVVYADVIPTLDPVAARRVLRLGPDEPPVPGTDAGARTADRGTSKPPEPRPPVAPQPTGIVRGQNTAEWHEAWFSHMARSLVAALRSPAASEEAVAWSKQRVRNLEAVVRPRTPGLTPPYPELELEQKRLKELQAECKRQYLTRLRFLGALFHHEAENHLAAVFLKARFWDMFIRSFVAQLTPKLTKEWQEIAATQLTGPLGRRRLFVGDRATPGFVFKEFVRLLTGREPAQLADLTAADWPADERARLVDAETPLLNEEDRERIAQAAGLKPAVVDRLYFRFAHDSAGVPLPFPQPDHRGLPPSRYLGAWALLMGEWLPTAQATVTTTETVEEDAYVNEDSGSYS